MREAVRRHYDSLSFLYRAFWGEHIHHGLWDDPGEPARRAQERLVSYLATRAGLSTALRVLDVGCGYGASGRWLSHRFGCRVTGLTISPSQARLARRRNRRLPPERCPTVVRGDAGQLPFIEDGFDVVWVVECLEHLADKPGFIAEATKRLLPGGRLALCSWERGESSGAAEQRLVERVCEAFLCPDLASAREHRAWCRAAGLRIEHQEDLTDRVRRTWEVARARVERPWLRPVRAVVSPDVRAFLDGFPAIERAYSSGAMRYGLLVATRSGGAVAAFE